MIVIGLTGGIGSGKSTVAELFRQRGVAIIDADVIAREITLPGTSALQEIVNHLGRTILLADGNLDRAQLRKIIFDHANERAWLEKLLHPIIEQQILQQIKAVTTSYCIAVIPLLFEVQPYSFINRTLVVDAPEQVQIERVLTRDKSDKARVEAILKAQASRTERLAKADDVIVNDGSFAELEKQVDNLHALYIRMK